MIGFYDYTVVLTYLGLLSSILGMMQAVGGNFRIAIFCLAFSGLCDLFDGKVARSKKDRTKDEKLFGIQIDSLCDVICFGVFPVIFCYSFGLKGALGLIVLFYYLTCSVIRLGYFNVLSTNESFSPSCEKEKSYHGLPITSIAIILPMMFLIFPLVTQKVFLLILAAVILITATLFVMDFKFVRPNKKNMIIIVLLVAIAVFMMLFFSKSGAGFGAFRHGLKMKYDGVVGCL